MKKRADGYYKSKITIGKDANGKPIIKYVYAKTQKELMRKRQEAIDYYIKGDKSSGVKLFGEYAINWFNIRKKPYISERTVVLYSGLFNTHILPTFGDRNLSAISSMDIQDYLNRLGAQYSKTYCDSIRNLLVGIFECAWQDGYILRNPATKMRVEGKPVHDKHVFTPEERQAIENVCQTHKDGLLLALLYYTGMRGGEIRALKWKNIDLKKRILHVEGSLKELPKKKAFVGSTKTPSSVRSIPIAQPLYDCLMSVPHGMPESFVLRNIDNNNPVLRTSFERRYRELMFAAGLAVEIPKEDVKDRDHKYYTAITPHTFRHNMATMLWENNIDSFAAAKILGHNSISTTLDTYTHLSEKGMKDAIQSIDHIFNPENPKGGIQGV